MASKNILIVGGGPTGLGTALSLAARKIPVTLIEKGDWPVDKVCGEGIMPTGVEFLLRYGVDRFLGPQDFFPFKGITYLDPAGGGLVSADFAQGEGRGIRRTTLSRALYEACRKEPLITLCPGHEIKGLRISEEGVGVKVKIKKIKEKEEEKDWGLFSHLLACDGSRSLVRQWAGLTSSRPPGSQKRLGGRFHFAREPWNDHVEVWWERGIEAYITPVSPQAIEVAFIWDHSLVQPQKRPGPLALFPEIRKRVEGCSPLSSFQSTGPLAAGAHLPSRGPVFLLGDAYLFLDGITGEGLSLGWAHGEMLADLLQSSLASSPLEVEKAFLQKTRNLFRRYLQVTRLALFLTRHPQWRGQAIRFLGKNPGIFEHLLEVSMGRKGWWPGWPYLKTQKRIPARTTR